MTRQPYSRRLAWLLVAAGVLGPILPALATEKQIDREITGVLKTENGVRVLRLWGDASQRGYAHGYLLGDCIKPLLERILLGELFWPSPQHYENGIRQIAPLKFRFTREQRAELDGMAAGIRDRLGNDARFAAVDRELDVNDLIALNTLADWQAAGCSSFAAWGPATPEGQMVVGRNLDFFDVPGIDTEHLIIAYLTVPDGAARWVTLSWPGMIGVYTGMSERGVVVAEHDAPAPTDWSGGPFVPRTMATRAILERVTPEGLLEESTEILRASRTFCGNNFLVAGPYTGQKTPAVVFEYDMRTDLDGGVSIRKPGDEQNQLPPHTIACTNHYRTRGAIQACGRYDTFKRMLTEKRLAAIDVSRAEEIQGAVAVSGNVHTVHAMIALPNQRTLRVFFSTPQSQALARPGVSFALEDLLQR